MNPLKDDEHIDRQEYRKANVDGLRTHALADFDAEVQAASTTRLGRVRDHHGADKHDEAEGNLAAFVGEQMRIHGQASDCLGDECTL